MILLADGGSTKVDWRLIDKGEQVVQLVTKGANPFFRTTEEISQELGEVLAPRMANYDIEAVHFFGAGCAFPDKNEIVRKAISENINSSNIEVSSDLLAAARGLCGHKQGIACILGTGSNSCFYDGIEIINNVSPLGYILGDEGSGAVLGRLFLGACLKNQLTEGIKEELFEEFQLTPAIILDKVYKQALPNRFLASIAPFISKHIADDSVYNLVYNSFSDFFRRNIMQYDCENNRAHFTGSIALHFADTLRDVASDLNIRIGKIEASPMEGLITYYS